jgi:retinaldehyde-binding protein 1
MLNPFYGYPAASTRGYPHLHHGRRRKRDLARTLIWLFWLRWRPHITVGIVLAALALVVNFGARKGLMCTPRIFLTWRASVSPALGVS